MSISPSLCPARFPVVQTECLKLFLSINVYLWGRSEASDAAFDLLSAHTWSSTTQTIDPTQGPLYSFIKMQWTHTGSVKTHTNILKSHSYKLFLKASYLLHHSFKCSLWNSAPRIDFPCLEWCWAFEIPCTLPPQGQPSVLAVEFWIHKGYIKLKTFHFQEHMLHSFFFFCMSFLRQIKLTFNSKSIWEIRETLPSLSAFLLFKPRKVLDPQSQCGLVEKRWVLGPTDLGLNTISSNH